MYAVEWYNSLVMLTFMENFASRNRDVFAMQTEMKNENGKRKQEKKLKIRSRKPL